MSYPCGHALPSSNLRETYGFCDEYGGVATASPLEAERALKVTRPVDGRSKSHDQKLPRACSSRDERSLPGDLYD